MTARDIAVLEDDPLWYKEAVIYEVPIKSFYDSNDDGMGDLRGLIMKLDYLENLGVTALWLLPFYPSPLRDDGYDISDYMNIHPWLGTLNDFRELLRQAHRRGIRIITELVLNHTSDQHPWFQKSRRAKPGTKWREFYVWSRTPDKYKDARVIFKDFESSNWSWDSMAGAYYWHRFYSHQPDLNFDSPKVRKALTDVIDFWMDMGVDGMRLDAVPYLYERQGTNCENLPETHQFLKKLRAHVDRKYKNRMLLAEANQWSEDTMQYFGEGDECHMAFNFPLMPRTFMALQMEDRFPILDILDPPLEIPDTAQWAMFLRNHDELTLEMVTDEERDYMYRFYASDPRAKVNLGIRRRLAPLLGNNRRRIELMNVLLLSLPGTPVLYYGDEIGMGDNYHIGDRNGVRTPMQWSPDKNAGFSRANPQELYLPVIIDPEYQYEVINVENQERNISSLLWWMRRLIAIRKRFKAFGKGDIHFLSPNNNKVLCFIRSYGEEIMLVVINLSRFSQPVELELSEYAGYVPEEVFSQNRFPMIKEEPYTITLGPHNHFWFLLTKEMEVFELEEADYPVIIVKDSPSQVLEGKPREKLERDALSKYIKKARWFRGKGRTVRRVSVENAFRFIKDWELAHILFVRVEYNEGSHETYMVPVSFGSAAKAQILARDFPQAIIAHLRAGDQQGVIYDCVYSEEFQKELLRFIEKRRKLKGTRGELAASRGRSFNSLLPEGRVPEESKLMGAEQSNTSIIYENALVLKLYRELETGVHPEAEMTRALTDKARYPHITPFAGSIQYRRRGAGPMYVGLMQGFVPNEGEAWSYTLDNVGYYFERILANKDRFEQVPGIRFMDFGQGGALEKMFISELAGEFFCDMMRLLGERTAQMHLALASITEDTDFEPESFSTLYQRSVYQSMRSLARQVFGLLEKNLSKMNRELKPLASEVSSQYSAVLSRFARMLGRKIRAMKIRIHGDYHLGQVLYTGKDFIIIDFEGEPAKPLSERRLKRSPLRDLAGMVRSFHYAAYAGLMGHGSVREEDAPVLEPWIEPWYNYVSNVFLEAYLDTIADAQFVPGKTEDFALLFEAFLLEKAVYELGYELNNRPDWTAIPLKGIRHILKEQ